MGTTEAPLLVSKVSDGQGKTMFRHVAAGDEFGLVVDENGQLYSWGSGTFGQVLLLSPLLSSASRTHH